MVEYRAYLSMRLTSIWYGVLRPVASGINNRHVIDITPDVEDAPVFYTTHKDTKQSLRTPNSRATHSFTERFLLAAESLETRWPRFVDSWIWKIGTRAISYTATTKDDRAQEDIPAWEGTGTLFVYDRYQDDQNVHFRTGRLAVTNALSQSHHQKYPACTNTPH